MKRYVICPVDEIPVGGRKIVQVAGRSIGIFNVNNEFYALRNLCPHQLAPLCLGPIVAEVRAQSVGEYVVDRVGEIIRCPWHGWEFDIKTGCSLFNPHKLRVRSYLVRVEDQGERPGKPSAPAGREPRQPGKPGEDPSVETYPVKIENRMVVLYI